MMNTKEEQMRADFETWFRKTLVGVAEKRGEDLELYNLDALQRLERAMFKKQRYRNLETQELWEAWQAAINSLEGKSVPELDDDDKTVATSDRGMLNYLMQAFEGETWECGRCGHSEDCKTMDSAKFLKDYLDRFPQPPQEDRVRELSEALKMNVSQGAYHGAMEDKYNWKRRALEAEATLHKLWKHQNDNNGPTHMGEPVLIEQPPKAMMRDILLDCISALETCGKDYDYVLSRARHAIAAMSELARQAPQPKE